MAEEKTKMYLSEADKKKFKDESSLIKRLLKDSFYDSLKGTKHYKTKKIGDKEVPVGITIDNEADIDKALNGAAETLLKILYSNSTDTEIKGLIDIYRKNPHMYDSVLQSVGIDKHKLKEDILRKGGDADELEDMLDSTAASASNQHLISSAIKKVREKVPLKESEQFAKHTAKLYSAKGYDMDTTGRSHEELIGHYAHAALGFEDAIARQASYIKKKKVDEKELYKKAA